MTDMDHTHRLDDQTTAATVYEPPTIELLGTLTDLTQGTKSTAIADMQTGIVGS